MLCLILAAKGGFSNLIFRHWDLKRQLQKCFIIERTQVVKLQYKVKGYSGYVIHLSVH